MDTIIENFINRLKEIARSDIDNWENAEIIFEKLKEDSRLKKKLSRLLGKIDEQEEFDKLINEFDKVKNELALKKLEIKNLKSANAELNSYLNDSNERKRLEEQVKLEQKLESKEKEIEKLNKTLKKEFGDKKTLDIKKIKDHFDREIEDLNNKIATQTVFNRKIRKENEILKKQLSDEQKLFENNGETLEFIELKEENALLKNKLSSMLDSTTEVEILKATESSLLIDLKNRDNQIEFLRSKVERDAERIKEFEIQFQKMNNKYTFSMDSEIQRINSLEEKVLTLTKENKLLIDDNQSLISKIRSKELEAIKLEEKVFEYEKKDSSESIIKMKDREILHLDQSNKELNAKISELRNEYTDKIAVLEKQIISFIKEENENKKLSELKERANASKNETLVKEKVSSKKVETKKPSIEKSPVEKQEKKELVLDSLNEKERENFIGFKNKWDEEEFMREKVFNEDLLLSSAARIEKSIKFWEINIKRLEFDRGRFSSDKVVQNYFDEEIKKIKGYIKQLKNKWIDL